MIFSFIKYVNPTWYFNLSPSEDHQYFPTVEQIKQAGIQLEVDNGYASDAAKERDLAWRVFQQGYINEGEGTETNAGINVWQNVTIPLEDEYRFIRKYYSPFWSTYILGIRILSFKNPVAELKGFRKAKAVKKVNVYSDPFAAYESNDTKRMLETKPMVSIIIPTLNRYQYLKDVLDDLGLQTHKNFEVIVVDQSAPFQQDFYKQWSYDLIVVQQDERALWLARNRAIKMAKGDMILLFDDDSRVAVDWIEQHLRCIYNYNADISSGVSISKVGDKVPENYKYFRWSDQVDTGNVMLKKQVFKRIGLFDRQFEKMRMGDGEFGLRAYLAGFKNISNPLAERLHLKVGEGGLREMGSWDAFRTKKLTDPRPIPSVLYLFRKYFGTRLAVLAMFIDLPGSIVPYKYKGNKKKLMQGAFMAFLLLPIIAIQVMKSWRISKRMIKEGDKIEWL